MSYLSEQKVRQLGLGFLKSYYRNRSRVGQAALSSDVRGLGGIRADGYFSFLQAGGKRFEATLEATSYTTRKELRYSLQRELLAWDAFTISCMVLVGVAALSQYFQFAFVPQIGLFGVLFWMVSLFLLVFVLYRFSASRLERYRYIYAVEQFRQYRADEQWIALSEEVFTQGRKDPFFRELRKQCIHYGIGLLWVDRSEEVQMLLAAARSRGQLDKRRSANWSAAKRLGQPLKRMARASSIRKWVPSADYTARFRRGYRHQLAISVLSLILTGGLLYMGWRQRPVRKISEREFRASIQEQLERPVPEPGYYIVDTPFLMSYAGAIEPYLAVLNGEFALGRFSLANPLPAALSEIPGLFIGTGVDTVVQYSCNRLPPLQSGQYLLRESRYERLEPALERMARLRRSGWQGNVLSMRCIQPNLRGYVVFLGLVYEGEAAARAGLKEIRSAKSKRGPSIAIVSVSDLVLYQ